MNFVIEPRHFEYLAVQCGPIAHLLGDDPAWRAAYESYIETVFESLRPALPEKPFALLDVAGGLSGIGARLNAHHGKLLVAVLDGRAFPPEVVRHSMPFNNATVTQNFLRANGVKMQMFYDPTDPIEEKYDIVISIQGWCFHFAPDVYMDRVYDAMNKDAVIVVDVRRDKPEWEGVIAHRFGGPRNFLGLVAEGPKWRRVAYRKSP